MWLLAVIVTLCRAVCPYQVCPHEVAEQAIADARDICIRQYGSAPDVDIYGGKDFTFAYVPEHLHHMLFELVKNSLRAGNTCGGHRD